MLLAACAWAASGVQAQTLATPSLFALSLDDLLQVQVVSVSHYAQPLAESPASVTVLGSQELQRQGYRTLADALTTVPGVDVRQDRNYSYLGVRGVNRPGDYNARILLLTDGTRRNDPVFDQAHLGHEAPIELDWVKRLEFAAGPASAMHGTNALLGTVNAVMLEGRDVNGIRTSVDVGSGHGRRVGVVAGQGQADQPEWLVAMSAYQSRGTDLYFPEFDNGAQDGWARGLDGEAYQKAYVKWRLGDWRLSGNVSSRIKQLPNAPYGTAFGQAGTQVRDQHALLELAYERDWAPGWSQQVRVFTGRYGFDGDFVLQGTGLNQDIARASWFGADYRWVVQQGANHTWVLGAQAQWNTEVSQFNWDVATGHVNLNSHQPSHTRGLYLQDDWRLSPQWRLNLGVRHDQSSDFAPMVSPRLALIHQPESSTTYKATWGGAYRVPNAYERFYHDGYVGQKDNPNLRPERVRSAELSADHVRPDGTRWGWRAYRTVMHDYIEEATDPADGLSGFVNRAGLSTRGLELSAEKHWSSGYRLRASVSRQSSQQLDGETQVHSPAWLGKVVASAPLAPGWTLSGQWLLQSERATVGASVAGYGIANLTLSADWGRRAGQLSLSVYNLTDQVYAEPATSAFRMNSLGGDGRQFRLRWMWAL